MNVEGIRKNKIIVTHVARFRLEPCGLFGNGRIMHIITSAFGPIFDFLDNFYAEYIQRITKAENLERIPREYCPICRYYFFFLWGRWGGGQFIFISL